MGKIIINEIQKINNKVQNQVIETIGSLLKDSLLPKLFYY